MKIKKRLLSWLLCGALLFSLCSQSVLAEGSVQTVEAGGLCEHHTEHDADCGYSEGTEGTSCGYVCEICNAEDNSETATPSNMEKSKVLLAAGDNDERKTVELSEFSAVVSNWTPVSSVSYGTRIRFDWSYEIIDYTDDVSCSGVSLSFYLGEVKEENLLQRGTYDIGRFAELYEYITVDGEKWKPSDTPYTIILVWSGNDMTLPATATTTLTVTKAAQSGTPDTPKLSSLSETSITLNEQTGGQNGVEYGYVEGAEGGTPENWQTSTVFNDLKPGTYTFYTRYAGNDYYDPSAACSVGLTVYMLPVITTTSLSNGTVGVSYSAKLEATYSTNVTWTIADNYSLPDGLTLSSDGTITGTPTAAGSTTFKVVATANGASSEQELTLTVDAAKLSAPASPTWDSTIPGKATWGVVTNASGYSVQLYKDGSAEGTPVPVTTGTEYRFAITEAGSYTFKVKATNSGKDYTDSDEAESTALNYYAVTFNTDGGSSVNRQVVVDGGKATEPTAPTKTGYTFMGWYSDKSFEERCQWDFSSNTVLQTTTLYAKWDLNSTPITPGDTVRYIVEHYKAADNGYTLADTEYLGGTIGATVAAQPKTYTGYTYAPGTEGTVTSGELKEIKSAADLVTLKLYYDPSTYTVTLDPNGGTIRSGSVTGYTYGIGAVLPSDVTKEGYTFVGWYNEQDLSGGPVTEITDTDTGDKAFYAKWASADTAVKEITVRGQACPWTLTGEEENAITVTLPYDFVLPVTADDLHIEPVEGARLTAGPAAAGDDGLTWRFTITAENAEETAYTLTFTQEAAPAPPAQPAETSSGGTEALIGAAVVIGGGAAWLAYQYREALPIWKLGGVVVLADEAAGAAGAASTAAPVANATVALYQNGELVKTLTTDANGAFSARLPKGTYEAVVTWERDGVVYTSHKELTAEGVWGSAAPVQQIVLDNKAD